MRYIINMLGKR